MPDLSFFRFAGLQGQEEELIFQTEMRDAGYFAFFKFAEQFRGAVKSYADENVDLIQVCLGRARTLFPNAGRFSPSWERLWDELSLIAEYKNEALAAIPIHEREGEWQVLLDNPHLPGQVVCYPDMAFLDAAYMYGYFRLELKPNEVLKLGRVTQLLAASGTKGESILPSSY